jgi:IPT/TIG domain-containing protein
MMRHIASRSASILFLSLLTVGCGNPAHNPNAANGPLRGFAFSPPSLTVLSPNAAPVNSVPFTIQVEGTNFSTDAIVFWNGKPLLTRFVNSQQLFADLASTDLMLSGMIPVYVHTGGLNSNTLEFDLH